MSEKVNIDALDDGPFIVNSLKKLTNSKDDQFEGKDKIALCRCGASKNKPYCDGSHKKVEFSSERETSVPLYTEKDYFGEKITIHDNRTICCHAGECVSNLNSVFDINSRPWINPDNARVEEIVDVIKKCPSGALSYTLNGEHVRNFDRDPEIKISKNGPYEIFGAIELNLEGELQPPSKEHYTLCRCGASKNKPYCDGSHAEINFVDENN